MIAAVKDFRPARRLSLMLTREAAGTSMEEFRENESSEDESMVREMKNELVSMKSRSNACLSCSRWDRGREECSHGGGKE